MSRRDRIKTFFDRLDAGIKERSVALYPPGDKRKLSDDIPSREIFRQLRTRCNEIRTSMLAIDAATFPKQRVSVPIVVSVGMREFLRLGDEFGGYYTREALVKVVNLYASLYELSSGHTITLDTRLASALGLSAGTKIPRQRIFELVSKTISKGPSPEGNITLVLDREREELDELGKLLDKYRHVKQQQVTIKSSPDKDMFQKELATLREQEEELEATLEDTKATNRIMSL